MKTKIYNTNGEVRYLDTNKKHFVAYFHVTGQPISLGINIDIFSPNIEIHVPFGFFRVGWVREIEPMKKWFSKYSFKSFGYNWKLPKR